MLPTYLCFAAFLSMLGLAAFKDLRERRIPNRLTAGLALLYPVYVLVSPVPVAWPAALGIATAVFLVGLGLFARDLIGGGDVKLIAAVSLWAGLEQFALFALVTTLVGGALAVIILWLQPWAPLVRAQLAAFGLNFATAAATAREPGAGIEPNAAADPANDQPPVTLPYGIAIAAGGVAVVVELMKL
jgi:prepilin peptidase CpaA